MSIEETTAALASITVTGMQTSEAITFLNSVLSGLTKPTPAMTKALHEMGYASAEVAVQQEGLPTLLQKIANSTDGSSSAIAKLLPNIRGLGGMLSLTGPNLKTFAENLASAQGVKPGLTDAKYLQATASDAAQLAKAINQIKNLITVDLGNAMIKSANDMRGWLQTPEVIASNFKTIAPEILGLVTSLGLIKLAGNDVAKAMNYLSLAAAGVNSNFGTCVNLTLRFGFALAAFAPAAYGLGKSLGNWYDSRNIAELDKDLQSIEHSTKIAVDAYKMLQDAKLDAAQASDKNIVKDANATLTELNGTYLRDLDAVKNAQSQIVSAHRQRYAEISKMAREAETAARDSQKRILDLESQKRDSKFNASLSGVDQETKDRMVTQQSRKLADDAAKKMVSAGQSGDAAGIQAAVAEFEKSRQLAGESSDRRRSEAAVQASLDQQIAAENQLAQIERQRNRELKTQASSLESVKDMQKKAIESQEKAGYAEVEKKFDPSSLEKVMDTTYKTPDEISRGLIAAQGEADKLRRKIADATANPEDVAGTKKSIQSLLDRFTKQKDETPLGLAPETVRTDDALRMFKEMKEIATQIATQMQKGVDPKSIKPMFDKLDAMREESQQLWNPETKNSVSNPLETMVKILPLLKQLGEQQSKLVDPKDTERLQKLEQVIQTIGVVPVAMTTAAEASATVAANFRQAASDALFAAMAMQSGSGGGAAGPVDNSNATAAFGGHFSNGGVGRDVIPAWLAKGEMVINARSAARFSSQLTAMNAGSQPTFRSEGGNTTNVGDVAITVNGAQSPKATAQEINSILKRGGRRGTI